MRHRNFRGCWRLAVAALLTASCTNIARGAGASERAESNAPLVPGPHDDVAYLTTSARAPAVGSIVTIAIRVDVGRSAPAIGSFVGTVSFDPRKLVYVGVESAVAGPSAVVHVDGGVAKAVGAAPNGFGHQLVALRFRVLDASALRSLVLQITELNDVHFASALPHLRVDPGVYAAASR